MRTLWIFPCLLPIFVNCLSFARSDRSPEQIAAERALLSKKTALLERENHVLRDENLELTRLNDLHKAEQAKAQAEQAAELERKSAQLKSAEATITSLNDRIGILESDSGGRIKQLSALNEQLVKKSAEEISKLQDDLARIQLAAAQEKEQIGKDAAQKEFNRNKELEDLHLRLTEKVKEADGLRRQITELRATEVRLQKELQEARSNISPSKPK